MLMTNQQTDDDADASVLESRGSGLKALLRFLQTVFLSPGERRNDSYRVHFEKKLNTNQTAQSSDDDSAKYEITMHFWCFNPAIR